MSAEFENEDPESRALRYMTAQMEGYIIAAAAITATRDNEMVPPEIMEEIWFDLEGPDSKSATLLRDGLRFSLSIMSGALGWKLDGVAEDEERVCKVTDMARQGFAAAKKQLQDEFGDQEALKRIESPFSPDLVKILIDPKRRRTSLSRVLVSE